MPRKKGSNTGIPGLSFSWKRATGVTAAKRSISKTTGIPTTKSGRQRKLGKLASGGCLTLVVKAIGFLTLLIFALSSII